MENKFEELNSPNTDLQEQSQVSDSSNNNKQESPSSQKLSLGGIILRVIMVAWVIVLVINIIYSIGADSFDADAFEASQDGVISSDTVLGIDSSSHNGYETTILNSNSSNTTAASLNSDETTVVYLSISETTIVDSNGSETTAADSGSDETDRSDENDHDTEKTYSIPSYWENMIEEKTKAVKALLDLGGDACVSFVWASDTHIPDNHTARTNDIGKLMSQIMDNCGIPFAVLTGDVGTRASFDTEEQLTSTQQSIPEHLAPLWGTERLLVAAGNHDGCYGDSSCYYRKQISPQKMWELYFEKQSLDARRVFSENGTYFYVDNISQKIRFIILNSNYGGEYATYDNGIAVNNRFGTACYGQEQLDWFADVALDMPEGYGAVIIAHVPPNVSYTVDKIQFIGIINAYNRKAKYSGSYTGGVDGWSNNSVSVDFRGAKGEIIAMFAGHVHQDTIDTATLACPLITIVSAGAPVNAGEVPDRTFYTDTETSFDVVTINRQTRTIYLTRVGAGEDRIVQY